MAPLKTFETLPFRFDPESMEDISANDISSSEFNPLNIDLVVFSDLGFLPGGAAD
jgi:hypothetical protein